MKIKMLEDAKGSECGKFVKEFKKGKIYPNVSEALAKVFIDNKLAEKTKEEPKKETKVVDGSKSEKKGK